ncbi:Crp/Fnr family transcriptional regulator [Paraferrimonas sedimenticola]|uniref:Transcriptional regulator n=1 Tax=Paraferrimonas sedimenticola TaxID=375674 RepID=A0AA37RV62_9GAMM|nr:helix-turn-helix domain-containing protein [Paraferrimonas sedimenticola]GLP96320.1 transcriptional regulator [Paraferrimonas sedimenticola]
MSIDYNKVTIKTSLHHCFGSPNDDIEGLPQFFAELAEGADEVDIKGNTFLFREKDPSDYVYILVSGAVMLERSTSTGSRQVFAFLYTGNLMGLSEQLTYSFSAKSLADATAIRISRSAMQSMFDRYPAVAQKYHKVTGRILALILDQLFIMGQKSAHQRLGHFLLDMIPKLGRGQSQFYLPMSRQDIADYLGMSLETASRGFSRLKRSKLIDIQSNYHITILDEQKLRDFIAD